MGTHEPHLLYVWRRLVVRVPGRPGRLDRPSGWWEGPAPLVDCHGVQADLDMRADGVVVKAACPGGDLARERAQAQAFGDAVRAHRVPHAEALDQRLVTLPPFASAMNIFADVLDLDLGLVFPAHARIGSVIVPNFL